jgi:exopolysaccharide biosynthesis polyprenyl glycosylphosphotransferase
MTSIELGKERLGIGDESRVQWSRVVAQLPGSMAAAVAAPGLPHVLACVAAADVALVTTRSYGLTGWLAVAMVLVTLGIELVSEGPADRDTSLRPVRRLVVTAGACLLVASSFAWFTPAETRLASAVVLTAAVVLAGCAGLARLARRPRTVLLVGGRLGVSQLVEQWSSCPDVVVKGVCLPEILGEDSVQQIGCVPVLGSLDDVATVAQAVQVDEVVVAPGPLVSAYQVRRMSWALEATSTGLSIAAELDGIAQRRVTPQVLGRRVTLSVRPGRMSTPSLVVKGLVDRVVAGLLLVVLSPVLLVAAVLVRRDSPGPALFRQVRVGMDGKPFTIYKFRTMLVDAESMLAELMACDEGAGPLFKMAHDPRTTSVGRFLRAHSIDELPQLVNVVRGEMSLVGPRPGLPVETSTYDDWIHRRLRAKPGMTGAWQVGGRSALSWTDSVRLDIDYVDNAGLTDDLRIAMQTARVVVTRDGAA